MYFTLITYLSVCPKIYVCLLSCVLVHWIKKKKKILMIVSQYKAHNFSSPFCDKILLSNLLEEKYCGNNYELWNLDKKGNKYGRKILDLIWEWNLLFLNHSCLLTVCFSSTMSENSYFATLLLHQKLSV